MRRLIFAIMRLGAALLGGKLRLFFQERRQLGQQLAEIQVQLGARPTLWVHVSSLGEYEMIRPLLAWLRNQYMQYAVVVTFFSPSGYRVRKNSSEVDAVVYLPIDTLGNMRYFFDMLKPKIGCIVKSEFWIAMTQEAHRRGIPLLSLSTNLGGWKSWQVRALKRTLDKYDHFLVQDQATYALLHRYYAAHITQIGDMRYDAVAQLPTQAAPFRQLATWAEKKPLILWGSLWPHTWPMVCQVIKSMPNHHHLIAPHQLDTDFLARIAQDLTVTYYSKACNNTTPITCSVLLLDTIGMLARCYRWAFIAYVGQDPAGNLHNVLEPAAYGVPVLFKYHAKHAKCFPESQYLIVNNAAQSVHHADDLLQAIQRMDTKSSAT